MMKILVCAVYSAVCRYKCREAEKVSMYSCFKQCARHRIVARVDEVRQRRLGYRQRVTLLSGDAWVDDRAARLRVLSEGRPLGIRHTPASLSSRLPTQRLHLHSKPQRDESSLPHLTIGKEAAAMAECNLLIGGNVARDMTAPLPHSSN